MQWQVVRNVTNAVESTPQTTFEPPNTQSIATSTPGNSGAVVPEHPSVRFGRKSRTIRGVKDPYHYYTLTEALPAIPRSVGPTEVGDLCVARGNAGLEVWVSGERGEWTRVQDGAMHPRMKKYQLRIQADTARWIQNKSAQTYKYRRVKG